MNEAMAKLTELIGIQREQNLVLHDIILQRVIEVYTSFLGDKPPFTGSPQSDGNAAEQRQEELNAQFQANQERLEKLQEEVAAAVPPTEL